MMVYDLIIEINLSNTIVAMYHTMDTQYTKMHFQS